MPRSPQRDYKSARSEFLVFGSRSIAEAEVEEVIASLRSGWPGTGPKVARFESDFAAYKGAPSTNAAAANSCTAALHVSLIAAGLGPGDEVITTPMTFCATVNAIVHSGATPVLADIDPATMNIDPDKVASKITSRTQAIVPVQEPEPMTRHAYHLYTLPVDEQESRFDRDTFLNEITRENIGVGVHYLSVPEHPYYQETFGWRPDEYPNAQRVGRQTVSLPLSAKLTDKDVDDGCVEFPAWIPKQLHPFRTGNKIARFDNSLSMLSYAHV